MKEECIEMPVYKIFRFGSEPIFEMYSHITTINSCLQLTKEEAILVYIELHKFIFEEE